MTDDDLTVPVARVRRGPALGEGGQGVVHPVVAVGGVPPVVPLVLKQFHPSLAVDADALAGLVGWRRSLPPQTLAEIDAGTAWPRLIVVNQGRPVGLLLPRAPAEFVEDLVVPSGGRRLVLREVQHLIAPPHLLARRGLAVPSLEERVGVLAAAAKLLALLHAQGVVIGDVSSKNALWSVVDGIARCYLLDCDAVSLVGMPPALPSVTSPSWDDPSQRGGPTKASDVYKFALFVVRALAGSFQARSIEALDGVGRHRLGPDGLTLLRASLDPDPGARPGLDSWRALLAPAALQH